ncbi:MAG: hypothetical protein J07HX5_00098 [halophilic archaeon J07HX5]|nr:MAG: hypothetical protein J07HX5_00098 [halophilic archaeon J07HX5]
MYTLRRVTDTLKFGVSCRSSRCTQLHYSHPTNWLFVVCDGCAQSDTVPHY